MLHRIVKGEEPIRLHQHEGVSTVVRPGDESVVTTRNYRDSAFGIFAALWVNYQGPMVNAMQTDHLKRSAQRYCRENMDGDFRAGRPHGAFKAKDQLVRRQFVHQEKRMGGNKYYALTQRGAQACYVLFNEKFHPSQGEYELIEPRAGRVDAQGNFTPHNAGQFPLPPPPQQAGGYNGFEGLATPGFHRPPVSRGKSTSSTNKRGGGARRPAGGFGTIQGLKSGNNDYDMNEDDYMDVPIPGIVPPFPPQPLQTPGHTAPSQHSFREPNETHVKRARMMKLDPQCANKIAELKRNCCVDEGQAWQLYESGAADEVKATSAPTIKKESDSDNDDEEMRYAKRLSMVESTTLEEHRMTSMSTSSSVVKRSRTPPAAPSSSSNAFNGELNEDEAYELALLESTTTPKRQKAECDDDYGELVVERDDDESDDDPELKAAMARSLEENHGYYFCDANDNVEYHSDDSDMSYSSHHFQPKKIKAAMTKPATSSRPPLAAIREERAEGTWTPIDKRKGKSSLTVQTPLSIDLTGDDEEDRQSGFVMVSKPYSQSAKNNAVPEVISLVDSQPLDDAMDVDTQPLDFDDDFGFEQSSHSARASSKAVTVAPATSSRGSATLSSSAVSSKFSTSVHEMYTCEQVHLSDVNMTLLVDKRERKQNNKYREFYQSIDEEVQRFCHGTVNTSEVQLTLGDFFLAFDGEREGSCWSAGLAIERKAITDIVSRSADVEGPHFKQERNLRYSGLRHVAILIEGDYRVDDSQVAPRVSSTHGEEDLERLDVISSTEELVGYVCGVICRNFGSASHCANVMMLQTTSPKETATLLTALSLLLADHYDQQTSPVRLPTLSSVSKYWHAGKVKSRRNELKERIDVSDDMAYRLDRRFGDQRSLMLACNLCESDVQRTHLLCDLSTAGSNLRPEVVDREEFPIVTGELVDDSIVVAEAIANVAPPTPRKKQAADDDVVIDTRQVYVKMNESMNALLMPLDGFADQFHFESSSSGSYAFCEITVEAGSTRARSIRSSSPLFIAVIPGMDMVELLCKAYDSVVSREVDRSSSVRNRGFDLKVVRTAVHMLEEGLHPELRERMVLTNESHPQLLLLVENLGHGGSTVGATSRLLKEHNAMERDNKVLLPEDQLDVSYLDGKSHRRPVSFQAAHYFFPHLRFMVNLLTAVITMEQGWQMLHVSEKNGALPAKTMVMTCMHEMRRLALLTNGERK